MKILHHMLEDGFCGRRRCRRCCMCVSGELFCRTTSLGGTFQLNLLQTHLMQTQCRVQQKQQRQQNERKKISGSKSIKHRSLHTTATTTTIIFVMLTGRLSAHTIHERSRTSNNDAYKCEITPHIQSNLTGHTTVPIVS